MESWNHQFVFTLYAYIYEMHRKEAFDNCVGIVLPSFDQPWKYLNVNIFYPEGGQIDIVHILNAPKHNINKEIKKEIIF